MLELFFTLAVTHITIVCVTLFLHRGSAHRSIKFHPVLSHFMRFWLWLTTGMITRQWVAVHRMHHQKTDQAGDPHSPHVYGIRQVLFKGALLYNNAAADEQLVKSMTPDIEDDWIERKLYTPHSRLGIILMLAIDIALFGPWGLLVWVVQMLWIPFWAAGVINGLGHWWGYRNHETNDHSTNIFPIGIIIGGEELHNNHHRRPTDPRLNHKAFELDIGYVWLTVFRLLGLAKLR